MSGTVSNTADTVTFGPIKYTAPGTYTYKVTETGTVAGVTNDSEATTGKTVTVTVADNGNGTLTATASSTEEAPLTFKNNYSVDTAEVKFSVSKALIGRVMKEGEFSFELKDSEGKVLQTKVNAVDGSVGFDTIQYTAPGVFTYVVSEVDNAVSGITYDGHEVMITVTVVDNGDGILTATPVYTGETTFVNVYSSKNQLTLAGSKVISGRDFAFGDEFIFELIENDTVIQSQKVTPAGGNETVFAFMPIIYTNEDVGAKRYIVREVVESMAGITYDKTEYVIDVMIADAGTGELKVDAIYTRNGEVVPQIVFINTYTADGELMLTAEKRVNGTDPTADQVFDFMLSDENGMLETVQNKLGEIVFTKLTYTAADLGKHIYTVKEKPTELAGYTADETVYTIEVDVADNGDGSLTVTKMITADGKPTDQIIFNNIAEVPLTISKMVMGCKTEKTFGMTVSLYNANGTEADGSYVYTGDVEGVLRSGDVIQLGHNQQIVIKGLIPGMKYKVQEENHPAFSAMVNNSFGNKAEGTLTTEGARVAYVNTLATSEFAVTKEWRGGDKGAIELTLYANGEMLDPQPECVRTGNHYQYKNLLQYDTDGNLIVYTAKEKHVDGYRTMYVNIAPYESVTDVLYNGGTVINEKDIGTSFRVRKIWNGLTKDEEVPEITLILYCNGEPTDYPTPDPDNNGWYKYCDLPKYSGDELAVYTVKEEAVSGFTVMYRLANGETADYADDGGTIINASIPQTGDETPVRLWLTALLTSAAALLLIRRKQSKI